MTISRPNVKLQQTFGLPKRPVLVCWGIARMSLHHAGALSLPLNGSVSRKRSFIRMSVFPHLSVTNRLV